MASDVPPSAKRSWICLLVTWLVNPSVQSNSASVTFISNVVMTGMASAPSALEIAPDAVLEEVVLGEGARVGAGVSLSRSVVWPGSTVERSHEDAIIAPHAVVAVEADSR